VSARVASPTASGSEVLDPVRALQHALYRAAKADPGRRFHALYDKVSRRDVLERAWELVRRNRGAPGVDQVTIQQVERYGVDRLLDQLAASLTDGSYRPQPASGIHPQARVGRAAAVVDPHGRRIGPARPVRARLWTRSSSLIPSTLSPVSGSLSSWSAAVRGPRLSSSARGARPDG
jgi:hypothetical protein